MDTEITKRGRGRPRKSAQSEKAPVAVIEPKRTKPAIQRPSSSFYLILRQSGDDRVILCVQYRMYSGVHREIIRTFVSERQRRQDRLRW